MDTDEPIVLSFNSRPAFQTADEVIYGELRRFSDQFDLGHSDKLITCFDSLAYCVLRDALRLRSIEVNAEFTVCS